jgi:hypothetical protein
MSVSHSLSLSPDETGEKNNSAKICIPVEIEIKDGRSAYAASLQMIFRHVADFHITVVEIISEKYNIPVDEIMNTVTCDSRYQNMVVGEDIHRLSTVATTATTVTTATTATTSKDSGGELEQRQEKQEKQEPQPLSKPKPTKIKKVDGEKKIKIKLKPASVSQ